MHDSVHQMPRWGNEARDRKALAIWLTLVQCCGSRIAEGAWLDVGCGSGGIAATLATKARHVTGIDPEPWETWAGAMTAHANLSLITGVFDGETSPIADASIDVVVCNQVYEHVTDPIALLRNIHRVLVPGGICYFAGPNLLWPIEPHVSWPFVHWLPRQFAVTLMSIFHARYAHCLDAWSWSYWKLTRTFKLMGFTYNSAIGARMRVQANENGSIFVRILSWLPSSVMRALTPVAPSFIFVLTKTKCGSA